MPRGGDGQPVSWGPESVEWMNHQQVIVEDWMYAGMDFKGDPDMLLPLGEQWDKRGKILSLTDKAFVIFWVFKYRCPNYYVQSLQMLDLRDP